MDTCSRRVSTRLLETIKPGHIVTAVHLPGGQKAVFETHIRYTKSVDEVLENGRWLGTRADDYWQKPLANGMSDTTLDSVPYLPDHTL